MESNSLLKQLGFIIIDELNDVIYTRIGDEAVKSFHKTEVDALNKSADTMLLSIFNSFMNMGQSK